MVPTITAITVVVAAAVLAVLATHDEPVAHAQVAREAGLSPQTASTALRHLEDAGIVTGSLPRAQRPGPGVRWSLNRAELDKVLVDLEHGLASRNLRS